jgi:transposase
LFEDRTTRRPLTVSDATGLAEALLGLDGFRVLTVAETTAEVVVTVETTSDLVACSTCGVRAESHGRLKVHVRDLPLGGRPARLVWLKRRWRCVDPDCPRKTWTENCEAVPSRAVLTTRASMEATRQVGEFGRSVAEVARELGVCWWTVMDAVVLFGTPLVEDPKRVKRVRALGIDETNYQAATHEHPTIYATGLVDLDRRRLIDMVEGNAARDLRSWCARQDRGWLGAIGVVATDLTEHYRAGMSPHLDHAIRVADPFHVVRVGNRCVDTVRRRVQNETLGHRGHKHDPLYRIRKLLLAGAERVDERGQGRILLGLRVGDPHDELLGAWLAKESVRDVYLTDDVREATVLLDKAIAGCKADEVREIRSLGDTLSRWRAEILNHHRTGASNGPTEGLNLCVKKVKRAGRGFSCFKHYRLRVLLHAGGITWPRRPSPPRIRTRTPHSNA